MLRWYRRHICFVCPRESRTLKGWLWFHNHIVIGDYAEEDYHRIAGFSWISNRKQHRQSTEAEMRELLNSIFDEARTYD